ncbi:MAG: NADH-quinone oxidoreductase subunit A [Thermoanaerobaculia bacterium]
MPRAYAPVLLALAVALLLAAVLLVLSFVAGKRTGGRVKLSTYESGVPLMDRSRKRLSIAFFLIAIDFVVFDVEAAFLYPWVSVFRRGGWPTFWVVMVFLALILVGYAYVWKKGGLDIATRRSSAHRRALG